MLIGLNHGNKTWQMLIYYKKRWVKMSLICSSCGKVIETLPLKCGYSISMNFETYQMECDMGDCGIIAFDKFLCESCCMNKRIMKFYNDYKNLAVENKEFNKELKQFKSNII